MFEPLHRRWTAEDEERLIEMFAEGSGPGQIARALNRTRDAVGMRRLKLQREGRCPTSAVLAKEG